MDTWAARWAAGWDEAQRFNKNHGAAGSGHGGQFTSAGGGSGSTAAAPKGAPAKKPAAAGKAKRLPSHQPNGLGYTAAQWAHLQQLEARHKAGGKLTAHELHELHVAHEKHEKHLAALAAAEKTAKTVPKAAAAVTHAAHHGSGKGAPKRAPSNTNKYSGGHPVKAI